MNATRFLLDPSRLAAIAKEYAPSYQTATPFPHTVIDNFLGEDVLEAVLAEFPTPGDIEWWKFESDEEKKLAAEDTTLMGPATRLLLNELNSSVFTRFLEQLTGIAGLIPDPHYHGGGLHQIEPGGFLKVHADFNLHPTLNLERRLNALVYLNKDWGESYGGHLELWNASMTTCEKKILPVWNRCVVFSTTDVSFHGHPTPLTCPEGRTRKSLALYYYTADPAGAKAPHLTLFRDPNERRAFGRWKAVARGLLPPVVTDAIRQARERRARRG